jgi:hypothetical protein
MSKGCRDLHLEAELFEDSKILGVELGPFENRVLSGLEEETGRRTFQEVVSPMAASSARSSASVCRLSAKLITSRRIVGNAKISRSTVGETNSPRM